MPNYAPPGSWECLCESGWYGPGCDIRLEQNCDDKQDNDKGKLRIFSEYFSACTNIFHSLIICYQSIVLDFCKNIFFTKYFLSPNIHFCKMINNFRRAGGLRGPRVLRGGGVRALAAVPHRVQPHRHPAEEAAARRHRQLLRAHALHHRGPRPTELRQEEGLQREVGARTVQCRCLSVYRCVTRTGGGKGFSSTTQNSCLLLLLTATNS